MKKLKKFVLGCSCVLFMSILQTAFATTGTVTGKTVRIRESADGASNIVTNVYKNDKVEILSETEGWYQVQIDGKTGYISKDYVEKQAEENDGNNSDTNIEENTNEIENTDVQDSSQVSEQNTENSVPTIQKESNLKLLPNFSSRNLGVIQPGTEVEIKLEINNWVQVVAGSNTGWVLKNNLNSAIDNPVSAPEETVTPNTEENNPQNNEEDNINEVSAEKVEENTETETKTGYINTDTARIRETPGGKIIGNLDINDEVTILSEEGDWYKITCTDFSEGYVSKSLITIGNVSSRNLNEERIEEQQVNNVEPAVQQPETTSASTAPTANNGAGIVEFANSYLGSPYVSGGTSPNGFDCSGFTQYVYSHFGYSIARTAGSQASNGTEVARSDLQPGDLILFLDAGKSSIGHAGIYIGDGNFIHAANPSRGVVIDNLNSNSYYNQRYSTSRRII